MQLWLRCITGILRIEYGGTAGVRITPIEDHCRIEEVVRIEDEPDPGMQ